MLDADGGARRVLRESELIVADVRERATAAAGRPRPAGETPAPVVAHPGDRDADLAQRLRDGHPVPVFLGQDAQGIGDLGHPSVDARLLALMLVNDTRGARLLREHGIDEAAVHATLDPT